MNVVDYLFARSRKFETHAVLGSDGSEQITFLQLHDVVQRVAGCVRNRFGTGQEMLLLSENSMFFIVAYLAILKSGNRAVLVEAGISEVGLRTIVARCAPRVMFVQSSLRGKVHADGEDIEVYTEQQVKQMEQVDEWRGTPDVPVLPDDVALVIFTSGSSGDKKGVMLSHGNIIANTESIISYLELTERDRMAVVLPFTYCYGLSLLHTHLRVGGSLVLHRSIFIGTVMHVLRDYRCTGFAGVPTTFQILVDQTDFLHRVFPDLRYMTQAGGKLPNEYIRRILSTCSSYAFYVMYGATEATARLSYLPPAFAWSKCGSIGRGIPGVTLRVVDEAGASVRPGVTGELVASGANIMMGYYRDPAATAAVLRDGVYYTGDLATIDVDGYVYIVGRKKYIIKAGGHRVSPYEIADVVHQVPGVLDCVVVGVPDAVMGEAVAVLVETSQRESEHELVTRILARCRSVLPTHKVPRLIRCVSCLPRGASNKIDFERVKVCFATPPS